MGIETVPGASSVLRLFKSSASATMGPRKVTIIGSGNWGSAIARIVGNTTKNYPDEFDPIVRMWVFEEMVNGEKLSDIINTRHENVKYLPGKLIPENVVAVPDLVESCEESSILIFVIPHQFVRNVCRQLRGKVASDAQAVSLIKGLSAPNAEKSGGVKLVSDDIREILGIEVSVLMGANLAHEVANDDFCEATIGCKKKAEHGMLLKKLFNRENFRINVVEDSHTVELCGALKNVVACAAGFTDGLGYGDNTKAAVIRLGLMEITKFVEHYYPGSNLETFFESCGIADLITTCYGGRNRKVCEAFVKSGKSLEEVEKELLHGQSAQGPLTAEEVYFMTEKSGLAERMPLQMAGSTAGSDNEALLAYYRDIVRQMMFANGDLEDPIPTCIELVLDITKYQMVKALEDAWQHASAAQRKIITLEDVFVLFKHHKFILKRLLQFAIAAECVNELKRAAPRTAKLDEEKEEESDVEEDEIATTRSE
ncbi:glycerol-3-phosphate dehydrogenase [NAD(P)+ ] [Ancylostoma ceylanicum]|uniref:Glycerol-3-phosphate dehydrogenase [NAD(+)] n=1 Tax=Ancylostoma ceylanicum TaxID=53326 RepID=A0A0D6LA40_9BILA|nr:glycerol-3-phosphate dehydrogenase [NAD(P)+ ] [Ancylostoma ceylanicum]